MYEEWWGATDPFGDGYIGRYVQDDKISFGCGIESFRDYSFGYGLRSYNERQRWKPTITTGGATNQTPETA